MRCKKNYEKWAQFFFKHETDAYPTRTHTLSKHGALFILTSMECYKLNKFILVAHIKNNKNNNHNSWRSIFISVFLLCCTPSNAIVVSFHFANYCIDCILVCLDEAFCWCVQFPASQYCNNIIISKNICTVLAPCSCNSTHFSEFGLCFFLLFRLPLAIVSPVALPPSSVIFERLSWKA